MGFFPPKEEYLTPAEYPIISLSFDMNYLEIVSDLTAKGSALKDCSSQLTSAALCELRLSPVLLTDRPIELKFY